MIPFGLEGRAGVSVWHQWWYRDQLNGVGTLGTALPDAIRLNYQ